MSKLKIGLIDWYIDEFHATYYVPWIRESALADDFEIALAWEDHPKEGGRPLEQWCRELEVPAARSLADVLEQCDCFCVLAPSNPEVHEAMVMPVLQAGKPVYLDKPFAPDRAAAERIFAAAERCGTPLWSSSALRFSDQIIKAKQELFGGGNAEFASVAGGGASLEEYLVHLAEMLVVLQGYDARRVMAVGKGPNAMMVLDYGDHRRGLATMLPTLGFTMLARDGEKVVFEGNAAGNIFTTFIREMLQFFKTGMAPVDRRETIAIAGIVDAMIRAARRPETWVEL